MLRRYHSSLFFFFNDTATTEIYTLSLHDALPILAIGAAGLGLCRGLAAANIPRLDAECWRRRDPCTGQDRKSTRLNSSHQIISYAVFCLKKKTNTPSAIFLPPPSSHPIVPLQLYN